MLIINNLELTKNMNSENKVEASNQGALLGHSAVLQERRGHSDYLAFNFGALLEGARDDFTKALEILKDWVGIVMRVERDLTHPEKEVHRNRMKLHQYTGETFAVLGLRPMQQLPAGEVLRMALELCNLEELLLEVGCPAGKSKHLYADWMLRHPRNLTQL